MSKKIDLIRKTDRQKRPTYKLIYVSGSGSFTSVGEERAKSASVYWLLCGFCWRGIPFLCVLGMGYVILLWHSLSHPYNYFVSGCTNSWRLFYILNIKLYLNAT